MATSGKSVSPGRACRTIFARIAGSSRIQSVSLIAGGLLLLSVTIFSLTPPVRAALHTGLFVLQTLNIPLKPQSWFTTEPLREQVNYPRPNGVGAADIYRIQDNERRAAVLLFLGANAAGRDDPDVINLGNSLARAGFVVMLHWSPTMGLQNNIDPDEIENLVWAFQYLRAQDFVDPERAGMGGFSVGGSFAMVAAADPRIRDDVEFINSFGAYYDAQDLFLQIASGTRFYQGQQQPWDVDRLTWRVFANELIETVDNSAEQELLERRFLRNEAIPETRLADLSGPAQTVRRLLEGTTPEDAGLLLQSLPAQFHQQMNAISPSAHVASLKARVMVLHDQGDLLIPVGESRRLAADLQYRGDFRYTETQIFDHVRPGGGGNMWQLITEAAKLYRHMYGIIRVAV